MTDNELDDILTRESEYPFVDKNNGETIKIKAGDAILATLRAWKINPNLTYDIAESNKNNPCDCNLKIEFRITPELEFYGIPPK